MEGILCDYCIKLKTLPNNTGAYSPLFNISGKLIQNLDFKPATGVTVSGWSLTVPLKSVRDLDSFYKKKVCQLLKNGKGVIVWIPEPVENLCNNQTKLADQLVEDKRRFENFLGKPSYHSHRETLRDCAPRHTVLCIEFPEGIVVNTDFFQGPFATGRTVLPEPVVNQDTVNNKLGKYPDTMPAWEFVFSLKGGAEKVCQDNQEDLLERMQQEQRMRMMGMAVAGDGTEDDVVDLKQQFQSMGMSDEGMYHWHFLPVLIYVQILYIVSFSKTRLQM